MTTLARSGLSTISVTPKRQHNLWHHLLKMRVARGKGHPQQG